MNAQEAIAIEAKKAKLIAEKNRLHKIVVADGKVYSNIKELLSPEALEAYEQDEIGQAYFDFIENAKAQRDMLQVEINAMPRIPLNVFLEMRKLQA
jgi:hypothetical protein